MSQSDRDLLALAAKASGLKLADEIDSHIPSGGVWIVGPDGNDKVWSPLHDDGDALRLAVKLRMDIDLHTGHAEVWHWAEIDSQDKLNFVTQNLDYDPQAATRRAIVRAAAEIGRVMS